MALSDGQLHRLMNGLAELYRPDTGDFPARVISLMRAVAGADSYSYNQFGPAGLLGVHAEPVDAAALPGAYRALERYVHQHPLLRHYRATGDVTARRISDFLTGRQFQALALYQEFYRRTGTRYQVVTGVPLPGGGVLAVALNRHSRDFSDEETRLVDLVRPHITQAAAIVGAAGQPPPGAPRGPDGAPLLTARQANVLRLVAAGQPDRHIARSLGISTRTVHAHLRNVYRALGVSSRTEALARLRAAPRG